MDPTVSHWAVALAEAAAPDEVDLAGDLTAAYLAGGASRRELYEQQANAIGGMGGGTVLMVLPLILAGLGAASPTLLQVLSGKAIEGTIGAIKNYLGWLELSKKAAASSRSATDGAPAVAAPPQQPAVPLTTVARILCEELHKGGMKQSDCERKAYRVLLRLLEEPASAAQFVEKVAASK